MSIIYYKIPLQLHNILQGNELPVCDLKQSINRNLELIIMTKFGEHRSDPRFGCEIWDLDFELIVSENLWEEKLRQSLLKSINTYEERLSKVDLTIRINEVEKMDLVKNQLELKKRINIQLNALIHKTGESFKFSSSLFLSPLTVAY